MPPVLGPDSWHAAGEEASMPTRSMAAIEAECG